jgi:hypothetical protein
MAKKFDFLSPGIEIREIDQSFIPAQVDADGPIIIGRTRKGPANKPVKVRNLDDFVSVFGLPIAGGNGAYGDMWRDGNMTGPTYASYAAQSWLASDESPVTVVRLAGEQHPQAANDAAKAGWSLSGSLNSDDALNSTAYGLFLVESGSSGYGTGSLAAVFYANKGYLTLSGSDAGGTTVEEAGTFVQNIDKNCKFKLSVFDEDGSIVGTSITFDFGRNSSNYIRSVFNTNPQLVNEDTIEEAQRKTYWLGESFTRELDDLSLLEKTAGNVHGLLLPLQSGSINWSYHKEGAAEAQTGWVISQRSKGQEELFKFKCLHTGEDIQKDYLIAIEQIAEATNPNVNPYGTFTVSIKSLSGNTIERYVGCNLNPSSPNYLGRRIGDQYMEWSDSDRRYRTLGDYQNQSNIVYVDIKSFIKNGGGQGFLPAGFKGPVRPKGFTLVSGSTGAKALGAVGTSFAGAFVTGGVGMPGSGGDANNIVSGPTDFTASFNFPSISLRTSGTDGGAPDPYRAYYGIRPALSDTATQHDPDYCDYLRRLPAGVSSFAPSNTTDYEHSFIFTLDDIKIDTTTDVVTYDSGSYDKSGANKSYAASASFGALLDKNVRQFLMPLHGGFEGFDITEKDPFRDDLLGTVRSDVTNHLQYTINKALDSIRDPEVVPANLLLVPGIRKPLITDRVIAIAEDRKDVLGIIDIENDYLPAVERDTLDSDSDSLGNVSSAVSSLKNRNLNSSYACAFYPWVQIADNLNSSKLVWIPPSIAALGAFGRSQASSELWFAPAGFNRGGLGNLGGARGPKVIQARQRLDSKERDLLYEVNINPIATFPSEGIVIFGQKTLQSDQSALDRINVRRLVLYLKAQVSNVARNLLFDQNVQSTWNRFKSQVNPILSDTRSRFGLSDYKLILDDTTTTADLIDRNIMYAKIYIKPARAIEYIVVDFVITRTGADFV